MKAAVDITVSTWFMIYAEDVLWFENNDAQKWLLECSSSIICPTWPLMSTFTIGSSWGTPMLKCCPCRETSGIKGNEWPHFMKGRSLLPGDSFMELGPSHSCSPCQACSTTESHFREPHDQLFWQHRLGSELLCPTCYMIQSPVCWSTNNLMNAGLWHNILSYFCFFNINLFTYGAKKCSESMLWAWVLKLAMSCTGWFIENENLAADHTSGSVLVFKWLKTSNFSLPFVSEQGAWYIPKGWGRGRNSNC